MSIVVIGVGNEYRRDDAVGLRVIEALRESRLSGVDVAVSDGEPTELLELWDGHRLAVVVDAVRAEPAVPGRLHRLEQASAASAASSHGLGLGTAVELGTALGRMPERLVVYAIEIADAAFGEGLTPAVAAAVGKAVEAIGSEIAASDSWLPAEDRPGSPMTGGRAAEV
jgi:hydrogenase maturation protease